jgi:hypothetical protein
MSSDVMWYVVIPLLLAAFVFGVGESLAQTPLVELGVGQSVYTGENESSTDFNVHFRVGVQESPVYGVFGYDQPSLKILGQPIADTGIIEVGMGARKTFGNLLGFAELGAAYVDAEVDARVREEIVYTNLVQRHNVYGRPVPVDPRAYHTTWEVDDSVFLRVGLQYQLFDSVAIGVSYRWLEADTEMTLKRANWEEGQGYWREDTSVDLGAAEFSVVYTY